MVKLCCIELDLLGLIQPTVSVERIPLTRHSNSERLALHIDLIMICIILKSPCKVLELCDSVFGQPGSRSRVNHFMLVTGENFVEIRRQLFICLFTIEKWQLKRSVCVCVCVHSRRDSKHRCSDSK